MKPRLIHTLGIVLITVSVVTLAIAFCQIMSIGFGDFSCFDKQIRPQEISSNTRIVYCIGKGETSEDRTSNQDEINIAGLNLRRDKQKLFVNNHAVNPNETYETVLWSLSINPWLIFTSRFEIRNKGLVSIASNVPVDVLYVIGGAYEGWLPNPLGLIILGGGIWLFWQGKKEKRPKNNKLVD